jgi:hypothetical protein
MNKNGTSFTMLHTGQKLGGILWRKWLGKIIRILACSKDIWIFGSWINFIIYEAI